MTSSASTVGILRTLLVDPRRQGLVIAPAANDNAYGDLQDNLLRDALKHFSRHGLSAAEAARNEAERAFFAGDRTLYRHWLVVCKALDQRLAADLSRRRGHARNLSLSCTDPTS